MSIKTDANQLSQDSVVDLFIFDATKVGGQIFYHTNSPTPNGGIIWKGNSYTPLPFKFEGSGYNSTAEAPTRPELHVSNINQFFLAAIQTQTLLGIQITRYRTYYKYTDNGSTPDPNAHFPIENYIVVQLLPSDYRQLLKFKLAQPFDLPNIRLPRRQILKDMGFPGVSRTRAR